MNHVRGLTPKIGGGFTIEGTDRSHPYDVVFTNKVGVVAVKAAGAIGGEGTPRIRVTTFSAMVGGPAPQYSSLYKLGWGTKPGSDFKHTSVLANQGKCSECGANKNDTAQRVDQAIEFLRELAG